MSIDNHGNQETELYDAGKRDFAGRNLGRADLRGANMRGIDLRAANLNGANLAGADLSETNLAGAEVNWLELDLNTSGGFRIVADEGQANDE